MDKYHIKIEYDGSKFVGWQYQNNGISVQEVLQKAFFKFLKEKVTVNASGRTDAGVHAIEQSAHIELKKKIINKEVFLNSINFYLKKYPVSVLSIKKKENTFHARYSAKKRTYKYIILNRNSPSPLNKNRAWFIKKKLDINLIKKALKILKGTHDFSTFRASSCQAKSAIRTLDSATFKKLGEIIEITFSSKSFLQQQVRSMVGAIKYVGEKKWTLEQFKNNFKLKRRVNCAPPAPTCGLYLKKVKY
jgi:tRNA pseudouridine38-40 synthase